jgi:hypothetical protein
MNYVFGILALVFLSWAILQMVDVSVKEEK